MLRTDAIVGAILALLLTKTYLLVAWPAWSVLIIAAITALAITTSITDPAVQVSGLVGFLILFFFSLLGEYFDSNIYGVPKLRYVLSMLVYFVVWLWIITDNLGMRVHYILVCALLLFFLQVITKVWLIAPVATYTTSPDVVSQFLLLDSPVLNFAALYLGKDLFFVNSNEVGFFAVASLFALLDAGRVNRRWYWFVLLLGLLLGLMSMSRAALLSGCVLGLLLLMRKHVAFVLLLSLISVFLVLVFSSDPAVQISNPLRSAQSDTERFKLAMYATEILEQSLWWGGGAQYYSLQNIGPHNFFLEAALMFGVIGMCLVFIAVCLTLNWGASAIILFLLISLFTHNIITSPIYLSCLFILGQRLRREVVEAR